MTQYLWIVFYIWVTPGVVIRRITYGKHSIPGVVDYYDLGFNVLFGVIFWSTILLLFII